MKLAIIGNPGFVDRSFEKKTEAIYAECGNNTGNLVFWHAFNGHVANIEKQFYGFHFDPAAINKCDSLVFILANHVNPSFDLGFLAERLDKVTVPVLAVGLGVQMPFGAEVGDLPQGSKDFFAVLARKASQIGVRGETTKQALSRLGIDNVVVVGCISNFIADKFASVLAAMDFRKAAFKSVLLNNDFINSVLPLSLLALALFPRANFDFIVQAPIDLLRLTRNERERITPDYMATLRRAIQPFVARGESEEAILRRVFSPFDTSAWLEFVKRYDFAFGSRMHGNMVCFQAGVPTIFVAHDGRTAELLSTMELPRIDIVAASQITSREQLLDAVNFDPAAHLDRRSMLATRYRAMLAEAGLPRSALIDRI